MSGNTIETLSNKDVQQMSAKDPKKVVYEYQFDTVDRVKSAREVAQLIQITLQKRNDLLDEEDKKKKGSGENRGSDGDRDEIIRYRLVENFPVLRDFQNTHPSIFSRITSSTFTPKEMELLQYQLNLRLMVETGQISKSQAGEIVQMKTVQQFQTGESYEDYKRRTGKK